MRVVFMGSPQFAVPALEALIAHHDVSLVVTQPDKRAGRGKRVTPPPVKEVAVAHGLEIVQPARARDPEFQDQLAAAGAELAVVVAYGKILPRVVLDTFPHGCFNIHASILPRYRGAAPIQWALINGEEVTGVTIMRLDEGMDTGPILLTREEPVSPQDTTGTLSERLSVIGARLLLEAIDKLAAGSLTEIAQDDERATYAPLLEKSNGRVDWSQPAQSVVNLIRGVDPWPGATTEIAGEVVKLYAPRLCQGEGPAGRVLLVDKGGVRIACGQGACEIGEMQAAGKRRMAAAEFARGRSIAAGQVLGSA